MADKKSFQNSILDKIMRIVNTMQNVQRKTKIPKSMSYYLGFKKKKLDWGQIDKLLNLVGSLKHVSGNDIGGKNAFILGDNQAISKKPSTKETLIEEIRILSTSVA